MKGSGYEKVAHLYDLFDCKANVPFFLHYASQTEEALDVGAGTGRIALPLARQGVQVFCVEPSPAMRQVFARTLDRRTVHHVLAEAGFSVTREWGEYDFSPYQDGDELLIVEAVRSMTEETEPGRSVQPNGAR